MKYRKKPVVIDAEQFTARSPLRGTVVYEDETSKTGWSVDTLEGKHEVTPDDYIITGVKGEKYPVKPDIFELTYEKV